MRGLTRFSVDGSRLQDVPLDPEDGDDDDGADGRQETVRRSFAVHASAPVMTMDDDDGASMVSSIASIAVYSMRGSLSYTLEHWKIIAFGQALSLVLACNGASQATLHFECSLSAPAFTMALYYFVLSLFLIPLYMKGCSLRATTTYRIADAAMSAEGPPEHQHTFTAPYWFLGRIPLYAPAWVYLGIAFLDFEANYFTVLAFRYTTLTSVTLFDALAVPSSMVFSALFLQRKFTSMHLVGVGSCMLGILYNVLADYELQGDDQDFPNRLLGDILAITGGIMFGLTDVLAEKSVCHFGGPAEFLGMLGFFATLISIIHAAIFERAEIAEFFQGFENGTGDNCSVGAGILLTLAFVAGSSLSYIGSSHFLVVSEATLLNLSYLTGDAWAVLFSIVAEGIVPSALFWVALVMTVSGVIIYEMGPTSFAGDLGHDQQLENNKSIGPGRRNSTSHKPVIVEMTNVSKSVSTRSIV